MIIATPYENDEICQHFGRAPQFKFFDIQPGKETQTLIADAPGSGHVILSQFLAAQGVNVVLCGGIGQGALVGLAQNGIDVVPGISGDPDKAVQSLIEGTLKPDENFVAGCGCGCGGHDHHDHERGSCGCGGHEHQEQDHGSCGCGGHHGGGCCGH